MGMRANLVVVGDQGYDLYYSHWCANTLPESIFWGPKHAEEFIRIQRPAGPDDWLDSNWAEGGVVLDIPRRVLLFFGGEDILYDIPLRRLFLEMMQSAWDGWTIRWAYEGIVDIAEYVGVPRLKVLPESEPNQTPLKYLFASPEAKDDLDKVASFESGQGIDLYPLSRMSEDTLIVGPELLELRHQEDSYSRLNTSEWTSYALREGFHINETEKTIDFWSARDAANLLNAVTEKWPGWKVTWHQDRYESQIELTHGALEITTRPRSVMIDELITTLCSEIKRVNLDNLTKNLPAQDYENITINPLALRDDRLAVDGQIRISLLSEALRKIHAFDKVSTLKVSDVKPVAVSRRKCSTWFTTLVVLSCIYVPLFIFLYHRDYRFDVEDVRLIVLYPGLTVARYIPRLEFYYLFEILGIVGAIWLARRSVIWLVGISVGALILSLFNVREMFRWG